ncbi:hypothetical protein TNCV_235041 [Trichonephila clavipes]|uniref:Uncharacterized protein n=1 Tax=Trichonephila clavipes TaxID=2585209 RepID=A0A8X6SJM1_TRICX|nr:hypothetical protein TNCV_235041 [Trichonephila clavipes]
MAITTRRLYGYIYLAVSDQLKYYCGEASSLFNEFESMLLLLFHTVKSCLKGTHFTTVDEVQSKPDTLPKRLQKPRSRTVACNGSTEYRSM